MKRRDVLTLGLTSLAAGLVAPRFAAAQSKFPERPIKLVIPFAPGGLSDVVGRLWADKVKTSLGPVFIENQGGAGGLVGGAAVARAQADGYTLLLGSTASQVVSPIATSTAPYDPVKDFAPISILVVAALGIFINPSIPARDLKELVDYAKANPGKLSFGSGGVGSTTHLSGELFKSLTGVTGLVHVPYRGGTQPFNDLVSGHLPMTIANVTGQALALHRAGKVRLLAVTTPGRVVVASDIPTAAESGFPGMISHNFSGLFAPVGTTRPVIDRIVDATRGAMIDDEFRQKLIASGFEPHPDLSPEAAQRFVDDDIGRWTPVIKAIGLKLEQNTQ